MVKCKNSLIIEFEEIYSRYSYFEYHIQKFNNVYLTVNREGLYLDCSVKNHIIFEQHDILLMETDNPLDLNESQIGRELVI